MYRRWRRELAATGALPGDAQITDARKWVMIQAHIIAIIPIAAVFLARGFGAKG
jgi:putative membrane protein